MGKVQQRVLSGLLMLALFAPAPALSRKFYNDDPLWQMPPPMDVGEPAYRKLSDMYDYFYMTFAKPGEKSRPETPTPAGAINTLGEVPDGLWYTNRHGRQRMSIEELVRGPGNEKAPSTDGPWRVVGAKTEGVTPGFTIRDSKGRRYQMKFDWYTNYELPTGADVMGSKFYYALGYFTPENYIVYFNPEQIEVEPGTEFIDNHGVRREMRQSDISTLLAGVPRDPKSGRFRAVASLFIEGKPLGPFRFHGVRADDPNDIVPHEHRRDLRGLQIFNGWLNHTDSKSLNSLDVLVKQNGVNVIRHYLLDFSAAFGTDAFSPKSPRSGHVYFLDWPDAAKTFFTFGLYTPRWARARYNHVDGAGRMESEVFDPVKWKSNYYSPAFTNCLPDDAFWAAKQVMRFTEPEIRALVETAQYSDEAGVAHLVKMLLERQRKIGQRAFTRVLPLDAFEVRGNRLVFEDLGVTYAFHNTREHHVNWSVFDNETERSTPINGAGSFELPQVDAPYMLATIHAGDPQVKVLVYVRRTSGGARVVGIERTWRTSGDTT